MPAFRKAVKSLAVAMALGCAAPAAAQILGGRGLPALPGGGLPQVQAPRSAPSLIPPPRVDAPRRGVEVALPDPRGLSAAIPDPVTRVTAAPPGALEDLVQTPLAAVRRLQIERLLRDHADVVEADGQGQPVIRGEVLALAPSATALARLRQAGFKVRRAESLEGLALETVVLGPPGGMSAPEAVRRARALDPAGRYDFNHLYQESGLASGPALAVAPVVEGSERSVRVGLIDGSVAPLPGLRLTQKAFAPGGARATAHATAVASLIAGAGKVRGAAPGARLLVADVYGPTPTGGSAEAIARALAWMAQSNVPVVNISLVGPPNVLLEAAVRALVRQGRLVVAAVGNDGPAAPPLYPASYQGVIAVTGVDARRRVLPEAGRGRHVDFAAPGAQMAAAGLDGGLVAVRGTSFAAPLVAGRLARHLRTSDPGAARQAVAALGLEATDLGARGVDAVYGRGLVAFDLRTDPAAAGAGMAVVRAP